MLVADMHCDTISEIWKLSQQGSTEDLGNNSLHLDLTKMKKGGYLLQNFALFVKKGSCEDLTERALDYIRIYKQELEKYQKDIGPVYKYEDIEKNKSVGKISALLTLEEGGIIKGDSRLLKEFYDAGVRMITLTWNYPNEIGHPNIDWLTPDSKNGLTKRGKELVEEMEQMGIIPDVSHLSDAGFLDVVEITRKPFVASHSNARAVCPVARNMTDEMIRLLGQRGGVMGLNFCPDFLFYEKQEENTPQEQKYSGTIEDVVIHAKHIAKVGGIEILGLGSDFDGIPTHRELPHGAAMPLLWDGLRKAGFTATDCDKIFYKNVLRIYKDTLS